jgi:hypothetical protein
MQPNIEISLTVRGGMESRISVPQNLKWIDEGHLRYIEYCENLLGSLVHVFMIRHTGFDATEVIVNLSNGVVENGIIYFTDYMVKVDDQMERYTGRHVIRPRGMFADRFVVGPDAEKVRNYQHIPTKKEPSWASSQAHDLIVQYRDRREDSYGPYKPFWNKFHSLSDSHGGAGVSPYSNWLGSPLGYQLRALEFYGEVCRSPLACMNSRGQTLRLDEQYWLGRTPQHELPQFNYRDEYDGWCPYEEWLLRYEAHDYTHLWRTIRAASELAHWNPFARKFLLWVWNDCTMWLLGKEGNTSTNSLFWSLMKLARTTAPNQTASWGGRGLYHVIRCFLTVKQYLSVREQNYFTNQFQKTLRHIANEYGVCHGTKSAGAWGQAVWDHFGDTEVARGFETQLLASVYEPLGLMDLLDKYNTTFPEEVPNWFEANNPVNNYGGELYPPYRALYVNRVSGYPSAEKLVEMSAGRNINGSSQDLDCHMNTAYQNEL